MLVVPAVSGCNPLLGDRFEVKGASCADSRDRLSVLEGLAIGRAAPPGAVLVTRPAGTVHAGLPVDTACVGGDSLDTPWLHSARLYRHPGPRAEIADFYRTAAAADGWRLDRERPDGGLCLSRQAEGHPTLLTLSFRPASASGAGADGWPSAEYALGPDVYRLALGHSTYDPETGCGDPAEQSGTPAPRPTG
ncbi:hypothetical protein KSE_09430 [Kitasatospora setae KM-6054]|uniref:Uncharacterized protein n=1 Tax=Kitasatospora setae (strain ATCC 33774 / DSM 43861 / JCM 3304 / KCC A-0304 / NBRC 14216 / KM-6054) TaxID=452652 RepID=E4N6E9_KITSK|nr:hypothetical protein KSE_09430 [Kitasatospora setae KM-6054]